MLRAAVATAVAASAGAALALSVRDVPAPQPAAPALARALDDVAVRAEPYCGQWFRQWPYVVPRDSVKKVLTRAARLLETRRVRGDSYELEVLEGIVWHHLYQLEVDSAFGVADRLAERAMAGWPQRVEAPWLKGVNLVKASRVLSGIEVLDSVRRSRDALPEGFLADYAALSTRCFLPPAWRNGDSVFVPTARDLNRFPALFREGERAPCAREWRVSLPVESKTSMPAFVFTADFSLSKSFRVMFPWLRSSRELLLNMTIRPDMEPRQARDLAHNPDAAPYTARITVSTEPFDTRDPFVELARDVVDGHYDAVVRRNELEKLHAVSLRCYRKSAFGNVPGEVNAVVVFERLMRDSLDCFYRPSTAGISDTALPVRYTITMAASTAIEDKAERILQDVLEQFDRYLR
jgi:hypothetical protein